MNALEPFHGLTPFRTAIFTLLAMGLLSSMLGCSKRQAAQPATPKFTELSRQDIARLEQQRSLVAATAKHRYDTTGLTRTKSDLPLLQRLVDDQAFTKTQTYELQCLGVAFGDVLSTELSLRWVMVTDEYGTDPTLRFKDTTIQINALTMISKRVEDGKKIDVADLLEGVRDAVKQMTESGDYKRPGFLTKSDAPNPAISARPFQFERQWRRVGDPCR